MGNILGLVLSIASLTFTATSSADDIRSLKQLPNGSVITLTSEVLIPANTDYIRFNSAICGQDSLLKSPLVCHCRLEVVASGLERLLLVGHQITIKNSVLYDLSTGYGLAHYRGYENHLEVGGEVVSRMVCGQSDTISPSFTSPLSMDEFKLVLDGYAELSMTEPTPVQ